MQIKAMTGGVAALMLATALTMGAAQAAERQLAVLGEGRIAAVPDMARISLGVAARDASAAGALGKVSEDMAAMLAVLDQAGLAPADVQTSAVSVQVYYENGPRPDAPPVQAGYEAVSDLTVRVNDLDRLGEIMDQVTQAGGNRLSGLALDVAERAPLLEQARRAAVADALAKAALFADAAGVPLGEVREIAEQGAEMPPMPMMEAASFRAMPIAAGEIEVTAQVRMVFALGE